MNELRLALRGWRRHPGFALTVALTVALGVGVNTAIFSFVRGVLLRPLPFADAERLVAVWEDRTARNGPAQEWTGRATLREWQQRNRSLTGIAGTAGAAVTLTEGDTPRPLIVARVTGDYFGVLGVSPALGRGFTAEESRPGGPAVIVLGQDLWRTQFHADPVVIGRTVSVDGAPRTVVGVAAVGFKDPFSPQVEAWLPLPMEAAPQDWGSAYLRVVARLRPGADLAGGRADLARVAREVGELQPADYRDVVAVPQPLRDAVTGNVRRPLLVLLAAVGMVLLLVCVNVAGLLLARGSGRGREVAVRTALGAGRLRLVRQMLVESLALAALGGVLGVLLGAWSMSLLRAVASAMGMPRVEAVALDGGVLGFAAGAALLCGLCFGVLPAWLQSAVSPALALRGGRTVAGTRGRLRQGLVVAEVGLALALLVGAGLLARSLLAMTRVDPGFDSAGVVVARLRLPSGLVPDDAGVRSVVDRAIARLRLDPRVVDVGVVSTMPMSGANEDRSYVVDGRPVVPGDEPGAQFRIVTPGYLSALRIPLRAGRAFTDADDAAAPRVALINDELARQVFGQEEALGRRLRIGDTRNPAAPWWTVVGIVGAVRDRSLDRPAQPEILLPFAQRPERGLTLVTRVQGEPLAVAPAVRAAVAAAEPRLALGSVEALRAYVDRTLGLPRLLAALLAAFAGLALLLAALGVYGVMAQAVGERRREFGVRLALGAAPRDLLGMVLRQAAGLAGLGVVLGLAAAMALGLGMSSLLFGVRPLDPLTWAVAATGLLLAATLASLAPARRAAGVDPAVALRDE